MNNRITLRRRLWNHLKHVRTFRDFRLYLFDGFGVCGMSANKHGCKVRAWC